MPLNSVTAPRRMFVKQPSTSKRYRRNPDLPDHVVVIGRLRSRATVLVDASVTGRDHFERMRDLPQPQWTADHLAAALKEVWVHRPWLWERDWEPFRGGCALPPRPNLDPPWVSPRVLRAQGLVSLIGWAGRVETQ